MSTMTTTEQRWPASPGEGTFKFPDYDPNAFPPAREHLTIYEEDSSAGNDTGAPRSPKRIPVLNGHTPTERWGPRRENSHGKANGYAYRARGHTRQKSLSDAIRTINSRRGSVTQNAQEIAEALKAPVSYRLVGLCIVWYISSALTNTSSKSILNAYPKPVTLTIVQFAFVSMWCWVLARMARVVRPLRVWIPALKDGLRPVSMDVLRTSLPLALFQLGGHILSSSATQRIPVSLVHTIKGLSPLFTVTAYRLFFDVRYSVGTYLSLIPLTFGVFMACSAELSGNLIGILSAFVAAVIFVAQNIFSKKLFNEAEQAEADALPHSQRHPKKLDKLNLLFYCSTFAMVLTLPIWIWTEGFTLLADIFADGKISISQSPSALDHGPLALEFVFNGLFHFGQNIIAFVLLSMVSPVTYSVASLLKRVFVIVAAILWFRSPTTNIQGVGILFTFFGLYLYDRTHDSARTAKHVQKNIEIPLLPLNTGTPRSAVFYDSPATATPRQAFNIASPYANGDGKKADAGGPGMPSPGGKSEWMAPGTRQEDTWRERDVVT